MAAMALPSISFTEIPSIPLLTIPQSTNFNVCETPSIDLSRKARMASLNSNSTSLDSFGTTIQSGHGEYLMRISLGSPPMQILAIADTGSDLTWIQCAPCEQCYDQNAPIFDPGKSTSYKRVPCSSNLCQAAGSSSCGGGDQCSYRVTYGDQSYTIGDLATDTLGFNSNSGAMASFTGFGFGCGHRNQVRFNGNAAGIVGLGGGEISMIKQLANSIDGKFSYCLTLFDSSATSRISFGTEANVNGNGVVSTPLVRKNPETYYFLTLEGISVAGRGFRHQRRRRLAAVDEGNIIIDSGTTLTYLPEEMYNEWESSVARAVNGKRVNDTRGPFGLCYKKPSDGELAAPPIVAHFSGGDVIVRDGTFMEVEEGVICFTFVPSGDLAIFGNLHQMNYLIGYDIVNEVVNFQPTDCSKSG